MSRYNLLDFNNILEATDLWPLSDETISIINSLVSQVGAPEYVKTPQFKKNTILRCLDCYKKYLMIYYFRNNITRDSIFTKLQIIYYQMHMIRNNDLGSP